MAIRPSCNHFALKSLVVSHQQFSNSSVVRVQLSQRMASWCGSSQEHNHCRVESTRFYFAKSEPKPKPEPRHRDRVDQSPVQVCEIPDYLVNEDKLTARLAVILSMDQQTLRWKWKGGHYLVEDAPVRRLSDVSTFCNLVTVS